jgi:hypothetical protein
MAGTIKKDDANSHHLLMNPGHKRTQYSSFFVRGKVAAAGFGLIMGLCTKRSDNYHK